MSNFDPGYYRKPFLTLCAQYPKSDGYDPNKFRLEWGPIFHRGRLDGSARVLVIGQDPAQHETITRRILVGEAGRRVQGFLSKLGINRSYVMINTFLFSVYGSPNVKARRNQILVDYRNRWLDALLQKKKIEAVIAMGTYGNEAWNMWKTTKNGNKYEIVYAAITHPTQPESYSKGNRQKLAEATKKMLNNWNTALQQLKPNIIHPDEEKPLVLYGDTFTNDEKIEIPEIDFPPGLPEWMRKNDGWARRVGVTAQEKRANITLTIPSDNLPTL